MLEMAGGLVEGNPSLLSIQAGQVARKMMEDKAARRPKMMQLLKSCPETNRLAQVNKLYEDLQENIPFLCYISEALLIKMEEVVDGIQTLEKEKEQRSEYKPSSSLQASIKKPLDEEGRANIFSVRHLVELEECAKSLSTTASNVLNQLNRDPVLEPRVFLLQPDWRDLLPQILDEVHTIYSLSDILQSSIRVIVKDVKDLPNPTT